MSLNGCNEKMARAVARTYTGANSYTKKRVERKELDVFAKSSQTHLILYYTWKIDVPIDFLKNSRTEFLSKNP